MQLMLIEQQNKSRLILAREEQDRMNKWGVEGRLIPPGSLIVKDGTST
jgi:hypothetical protein